MATSIKVAVKIRPVLENEECISVEDFNFNTFSKTVSLKKKNYSFDFVYSNHTKNSEIFKDCIFGSIEKILEGFNFTIFAYGATGSGKSYTMGTVSKVKNDISVEQGLIQLSVQELFNQLLKRKEKGQEFSLKVSFLEIYNEEIYDLLRKSEVGKVHDDRDGTIKVSNLTEIEIMHPDELLACLYKGNKQRHISSTARNKMSSRSHAILNISIEVLSLEKSTSKANFKFVDLAGSERQYESNTTGIGFKEGTKINTGLFHLGSVLKDLSEKKNPSYRNSKLTRLLQDSIGGSSNTIMIACINMAAYAINENYGTLHYASITRKIQNRIVANITQSPDIVINGLKSEIKRLTKQISDLGKKEKVTENIACVLEQLNVILEEFIDEAHSHEKLKLMIDRFNEIRNEVKTIKNAFGKIETFDEYIPDLKSSIASFKPSIYSFLPNFNNTNQDVVSVEKYSTLDEPTESFISTSCSEIKENINEDYVTQLNLKVQDMTTKYNQLHAEYQALQLAHNEKVIECNSLKYPSQQVENRTKTRWLSAICTYGALENNETKICAFENTVSESRHSSMIETSNPKDNEMKESSECVISSNPDELASHKNELAFEKKEDKFIKDVAVGTSFYQSQLSSSILGEFLESSLHKYKLPTKPVLKRSVAQEDTADLPEKKAKI